jgi:ABC-type phosphate transport system substrate-binding protein
MTTARRLPALLAVAAVALVVAGCGGSDDSGSETSTPTASTPATTGGGSTQTEPMVTTGMAKCTESEISKAVEQTGSQESGEAVLADGADSYKCADGWAVAFANVGTGQEQVTSTVVFQAEGQFWVPQDRAKVCPEPSEVPKAIYDLACNSN